ncbi:hypothetical protein [Klebsiella quasipneumoniae]|uniref:hypothetical protein n=1 Tax=Klebsiella quasipneumoniae TaxID=1463165 RepID=UPI003DA1FC9E
MNKFLPVLVMICISGCDDARSSPPPIPDEPHAKEGANKQVISSQADSLIKISRIWAEEGANKFLI